MPAPTDHPMTAGACPWEIVGERLRVGGRTIALGDIRSHSWSIINERDRDGYWLLVAVFCLVAWTCMFGVLEIGWRTRFLLGAGLAALIVVTAFEDIWRASRVELHEIDILLVSGDRLVFSTGDAREAGALATALTQTRLGT